MLNKVNFIGFQRGVVSLGISITAVAGFGLAVGQTSDDMNLFATLERLEQAYGGPKLAKLKTASIERDRRLAWPGQGQSADIIEFVPYRLINHYDLENQLGSQESWIRQNGNIYHDSLRLTEEGARRSDYFTMTYTDLKTRDYFRIFGAGYRLSDTLMAHSLTQGLAETSYSGTTFYQGEEHDVLTAEFAAEGQEMEIYVSKTSGRMTRLNMDRPLGRVSILFDDFKTVDGLTSASENRLYVDDRLVEYEDDLEFIPNKRVAKHIAWDKTLSAAPTPVDTSEMTFEEIASEAYLVGQEDYSLFAVEDGALIAVNGAAGLMARHEALTQNLQRTLPLTDVILTHHHEDHIQDAVAAAEQGARLWVTGETQKVLMKANPEAKLNMHLIEDGEQFGPFTLYVRPTGHAVENVFVYHGASGALFQDDHYHGMVEDGPSRAQPTVVTLNDIIEALGIEVNYLLSGHTKKAESWADFRAALEKRDPENACPSGRKICRDQLVNL